MDNQTRVLVIALVVIVVAMIGLWQLPTVGERLAPVPRRAWVAIEVAARGVAEVGPVHIEAGTPFTLHAVLEAAGRGGRPVYYTRAPALRFHDGQGGAGRRVEGRSVRPWTRAPVVKIRWFTVEGSRPYLRLAADDDPDRFALQTFFRSDWPDGWTVPGSVDAANDDHLSPDPRAVAPRVQRFGTQRYHVRIELYADEESVLPAQRLVSWGPDDLPAELARFPTVVATLPGALASTSKVFGLTHLQPPEEASTATLQRLHALADQGLAFTRLTVVLDRLRAAGRRLEDLAWQPLELDGSRRWGRPAAEGDLLRVGERIVVLYQDAEPAGIVDYQDLCFDFVRGAAIRRLGDVFSSDGEEDQVVELAALGG